MSPAKCIRKASSFDSGHEPSARCCFRFTRYCFILATMQFPCGQRAAIFEGPSKIAARCPQGNCIVAKMKQYLVNLKQHRADGSWPESKELAFLMHFAGDIHQ